MPVGRRSNSSVPSSSSRFLIWRLIALDATNRFCAALRIEPQRATSTTYFRTLACMVGAPPRASSQAPPEKSRRPSVSFERLRMRDDQRMVDILDLLLGSAAGPADAADLRLEELAVDR